MLRLAIDGGETWETVATTLRPETEADAARTDELRRMIQADEETWTKYCEAYSSLVTNNVVRIGR